MLRGRIKGISKISKLKIFLIKKKKNGDLEICGVSKDYVASSYEVKKKKKKKSKASIINISIYTLKPKPLTFF